jgi:hypothetical protein
MYHIAESIRIAQEMHQTCASALNNVEFEIRCLVDPRMKTDNVRNSNFIIPVKKFIEQYLGKLPATIEQTANFLYPDQKIKQLYFNEGIQNKTKRKIYQKIPVCNKLLLASRKGVSYKICVSRETDIPEKELTGEYETARFKTRLSLRVDIWRIDITLVKESSSREMNELRRIRDLMFSINSPDEFKKTDIWDYADRLEFELECMDLPALAIKSLKIVDEIFAGETNTLTRIAGMLGSAASDFKSILPKPIEIHRKQFFDLLHPHMDDYYVTDKADGVRCLVCIKKKSVECITGIGIEQFTIDVHHDNLFIFDTEKITSSDLSSDLSSDSKSDTEKITSSDSSSDSKLNRGDIHIFDVLVFDGEVVTDLPFEERLALMKTYRELPVKTFYDLKNDRQAIKTALDSLHGKPYETDGLIFTSRNQPYLSTNYYKWKPSEKTTIDFIAIKCPRGIMGIDPYTFKKDKQLYLLFSEINFIEAKKLRLRLDRNISKCFEIGEGLNKCLFNPSDNEKVSHILYSDNLDLNNKVVELSWDFMNGWDLVRVRADRKWGNYYRIADMIWRNIHNPITKKDLISANAPSSYFSKSPSAMYDVSRKLCNYVKQCIVDRELNDIQEPIVIDLGCGNAQDIGKYLSKGFETVNQTGKQYKFTGVKQLYMLDADPLAINEAIDRKYNYVGNRKKRFTTKINIKQMDLSQPYGETLKLLNDSFYMRRASNVFCNFALHYLINSKNSALNVGKLVSSLMRVGGTFSYIAFDAELVFEALKSVSDGNTLDWSNDFYNSADDSEKVMFSIKKGYPSTHTTIQYGKKIGVLLPFKNEYHDEYLIPKSVDKLFLKCGLKKISEKYITDFAQGYKNKMGALTKNNIDYCRMMKCVTYRKSK